jgi:hypothetical protein
MSDSFDGLKNLHQTLEHPSPVKLASPKSRKTTDFTNAFQIIQANLLAWIKPISALSKNKILIYSSGVIFVVFGSFLTKNFFDVEAAKKPKLWPEYALTNFGNVKVLLKTSYKDNQVYYHMIVTPVSKKLSTAMNQYPFATNKGFGLDLYDKDGFKIFSQQIALSDMTSIVDNKDKIQAYDVNSKFSLSLDDYKAITREEVTYRLSN